jgi:hypothetical protein
MTTTSPIRRPTTPLLLCDTTGCRNVVAQDVGTTTCTPCRRAARGGVRAKTLGTGRSDCAVSEIPSLERESFFSGGVA